METRNQPIQTPQVLLPTPYANATGVERQALELIIRLRAQKNWVEMVNFILALPSDVASMESVTQQLGFALNRSGRDVEAEGVLVGLLKRSVEPSETLGILGRVYKDRWHRAAEQRDANAPYHLRQTIETYLAGVQANPKNAYPAINALTLLEIADPSDPRIAEIRKAVIFGVQSRLNNGPADYFDHATILEAAIIGDEKDLAFSAFDKALIAVRELWEPETTAYNLGLLRQARVSRDAQPSWATAIELQLQRRALAS